MPDVSSNPGHTGNDTFAWTARVYYEDTDAGGVVFYANYLKFFERARTEWLRAHGYSQHCLVQNEGVLFVVKSAAIDYFSPARLDDELKLTVAVEQYRHASLRFIQEAWSMQAVNPTLLASARVTIACVDATHLRPRPIPAEMLRRLRENI